MRSVKPFDRFYTSKNKLQYNKKPKNKVPKYFHRLKKIENDFSLKYTHLTLFNKRAKIPI